MGAESFVAGSGIIRPAGTCPNFKAYITTSQKQKEDCQNQSKATSSGTNLIFKRKSKGPVRV